MLLPGWLSESFRTFPGLFFPRLQETFMGFFPGIIPRFPQMFLPEYFSDVAAGFHLEIPLRFFAIPPGLPPGIYPGVLPGIFKDFRTNSPKICKGVSYSKDFYKSSSKVFFLKFFTDCQQSLEFISEFLSEVFPL